VFAKSSQGIFRITLKIDGRLIRNYGDSSYPKTLSGFLEWQGAKHISPGRHTLTFLAYDQERNVSETSLTIYHGGGVSHHTAGTRRKGKGHHRRIRHSHRRSRR